MKTEMQELRQKVASALERSQAARLPIGCSLETRLGMQGVLAGSITILEMILDWIDEIVEGKDEP